MPFCTVVKTSHFEVKNDTGDVVTVVVVVVSVILVAGVVIVVADQANGIFELKKTKLIFSFLLSMFFV